MFAYCFSDRPENSSRVSSIRLPDGPAVLFRLPSPCGVGARSAAFALGSGTRFQFVVLTGVAVEVKDFLSVVTHRIYLSCRANAEINRSFGYFRIPVNIS